MSECQRADLARARRVPTIENSITSCPEPIRRRRVTYRSHNRNRGGIMELMQVLVIETTVLLSANILAVLFVSEEH